MITIIGESDSERIIDINRVAKKFHKKEINILHLDNLKKEEIPAIIKKNSGEVVLYFGLPSVEKPIRDILKKGLLKKTKLINRAVVKKEKIKNKSWQQKIIQKKKLTGIYSFRFTKWNNLEEKIKKHKILKFPFILKKEVGSKGEQVYLIKKFSDLSKFKENLNEYLFQPFIENDGDFRIFMIGNEPQGIILRKGAKGEYRNNISQGGSAEIFKDKKLTKEMYAYSKKLMKIFKCEYAGIDLIYDTKDKKIRFMEMNFMPQWDGFAKSTKIDIAKKLLDYAYKQTK